MTIKGTQILQDGKSVTGYFSLLLDSGGNALWISDPLAGSAGLATVNAYNGLGSNGAFRAILDNAGAWKVYSMRELSSGRIGGFSGESRAVRDKIGEMNAELSEGKKLTGYEKIRNAWVDDQGNAISADLAAKYNMKETGYTQFYDRTGKSGFLLNGIDLGVLLTDKVIGLRGWGEQPGALALILVNDERVRGEFGCGEVLAVTDLNRDDPPAALKNMKSIEHSENWSVKVNGTTAGGRLEDFALNVLGVRESTTFTDLDGRTYTIANGEFLDGALAKGTGAFSNFAMAFAETKSGLRGLVLEIGQHAEMVAGTHGTMTSGNASEFGPVRPETRTGAFYASGIDVVGSPEGFTPEQIEAAKTLVRGSGMAISMEWRSDDGKITSGVLLNTRATQGIFVLDGAFSGQGVKDAFTIVKHAGLDGADATFETYNVDGIRAELRSFGNAAGLKLGDGQEYASTAGYVATYGKSVYGTSDVETGIFKAVFEAYGLALPPDFGKIGTGTILLKDGTTIAASISKEGGIAGYSLNGADFLSLSTLADGRSMLAADAYLKKGSDGKYSVVRNGGALGTEEAAGKTSVTATAAGLTDSASFDKQISFTLDGKGYLLGLSDGKVTAILTGENLSLAMLTADLSGIASNVVFLQTDAFKALMSVDGQQALVVKDASGNVVGGYNKANGESLRKKTGAELEIERSIIKGEGTVRLENGSLREVDASVAHANLALVAAADKDGNVLRIFFEYGQDFAVFNGVVGGPDDLPGLQYYMSMDGALLLRRSGESLFAYQVNGDGSKDLLGGFDVRKGSDTARTYSWEAVSAANAPTGYGSDYELKKAAKVLVSKTSDAKGNDTTLRVFLGASNQVLHTSIGGLLVSGFATRGGDEYYLQLRNAAAGLYQVTNLGKGTSTQERLDRGAGNVGFSRNERGVLTVTFTDKNGGIHKLAQVGASLSSGEGTTRSLDVYENLSGYLTADEMNVIQSEFGSPVFLGLMTGGTHVLLGFSAAGKFTGFDGVVGEFGSLTGALVLSEKGKEVWKFTDSKTEVVQTRVSEDMTNADKSGVRDDSPLKKVTESVSSIVEVTLADGSKATDKARQAAMNALAGFGVFEGTRFSDGAGNAWFTANTGGAALLSAKTVLNAPLVFAGVGEKNQGHLLLVSRSSE
ncbi:MAG TPA: hypothetical protein PLY30_01405, partial [Candidatus Omnitrophota bacterium]|nr:hypothetical protein [Candidatus Omnitrophota bacterium]